MFSDAPIRSHLLVLNAIAQRGTPWSNTQPHQETKRLDAKHGYSRKKTSPRAPTRGENPVLKDVGLLLYQRSEWGYKKGDGRTTRPPFLRPVKKPYLSRVILRCKTWFPARRR